MTITGKKKKLKQPKRTAVCFIFHWQSDQLNSRPVTMVVCGGVAISSKGRGRGIFLRLGRFGRRGGLLEVQVLQGHVQGHDLYAAHGLEVSEVPQRAVAVVLVLGGGGRGVLVRQQRGEQQFRHEQAPVGPLGLARLPLCLGQPWFAQPEEGASEKYCQC